MRNGAVYIAVRDEIERQLGFYGIAEEDLKVSKGSQQTKQSAGASSGSKKYQVFVTLMTGNELSREQVNRLNSDKTEFQSNHNHIVSASCQIDVLTDYDPRDAESIPAMELCSTIRDMIMHRDSINSLKGKGVFVGRPNNFRPSFQYLDQEQYESMPGFDLQITYNTNYVKTLETIESVSGETEGF